MSAASLSPWIIEKIQKGEAVLFLGAGASIGAKGPHGEVPPKGDELRDEISSKFLGGAYNTKPLSQVAEYAKNESSLYEVQSFIADILLPLEPAKFHELISEFRWHAIVTTNYDLIVEKAYAQASNPLQKISSIIGDDSDFKNIISDPGCVPLLKLHGCITNINDNKLPLILAAEEYAKHKKNREKLFGHLKEWGRVRPIIFCGYDVADPNIQQILFDLGDNSINRPMYVVVRPDMIDFDMRYWSARRFIPIASKFEVFLNYLDKTIPKETRVLSALLNHDQCTLRPWITAGDPSDSLLSYLGQEIDHVRKGMSTRSIAAKDFYSGNSDEWGVMHDELDVRRRLSDDLLIDIAMEIGEAIAGPRVYLLKGYAGAGKTVTLRRFSWESAHNHNRLVFWINEQSKLRIELLSEVCNLTNERIIVVIDNAIRHISELKNAIEAANRKGLSIDFVLGARTNEWNVYGDDLDLKVDKSYELRDLSQKEIADLLGKLTDAKCLGHLQDVKEEDRKEFFSLTADRQLLVALHEATSGEKFETIVFDEYKKVVPREAQILYLDVCTLHRFGVGVRAGLLSRVSGITMPQFEREFFKPLEHLVRTYYDVSSRDYAYKTRHSLIADFVFKQTLSEQEDRANQIVRIIKFMNVDYESDQIAFDQLIRGKDLAELFSEWGLGDRIFEAALSGTGNPAHIHHQRALFELNHQGGSAKRALDEVNIALSITNKSKNSISHTKAMVLRKMALESGVLLEKEKLRSDAKEILDRLIKRRLSPHAYHTKGQVLMDELRDRLHNQDDSLVSEHIVYTLIRDIEKVIADGLQTFSGESYLMNLEADLKILMDDAPGALKSIEAAFKANTSDGYAAVRLAKAYRDRGDDDLAKNVLASCIEKNPAHKLARVEYAKCMIEEDEQGNSAQINRHLRASFADGDTNYDAQLWYARHNYLYGSKDVATDTFSRLTKAKVPAEVRNRVRGLVRSKDSKDIVYSGSIAVLNDSFCFAHVPELGANIF